MTALAIALPASTRTTSTWTGTWDTSGSRCGGSSRRHVVCRVCRHGGSVARLGLSALLRPAHDGIPSKTSLTFTLKNAWGVYDCHSPARRAAAEARPGWSVAPGPQTRPSGRWGPGGTLMAPRPSDGGDGRGTRPGRRRASRGPPRRRSRLRGRPRGSVRPCRGPGFTVPGTASSLAEGRSLSRKRRARAFASRRPGPARAVSHKHGCTLAGRLDIRRREANHA